MKDTLKCRTKPYTKTASHGIVTKFHDTVKKNFCHVFQNQGANAISPAIKPAWQKKKCILKTNNHAIQNWWPLVLILRSKEGGLTLGPESVV